jgi:ADP-heptose:LPS heptosyltransferase
MPDRQHEVEKALALVTWLGAPDRGNQIDFPLLPQDHAAAAALLANVERPLIGLHPAAREATKRWMPERFAETGKELQRRYGGTVVVVGGPDERSLGQEVANAAGDRSLNLAGRTPLPVLGALLSRLAVFITNDSGPAHIAYALRVPTVAIFGGTDPTRWGPPRGEDFRVLINPIACWPCDYGECPFGYTCLQGISVDQVLEKAAEVIRL